MKRLLKKCIVSKALSFGIIFSIVFQISIFSQDWIPDEQPVPDKQVVPEKKVAPPKKTLPQKKVAPKKYVAPKKKVAPKKYVAPKKKVAPKKYVAPKKKVVPKKYVAPKKKVVPKKYVAPKKKVAPKKYVTPPKKTVPEKIIAPKENVIPEKGITSEDQVIPAEDTLPGKKITPEDDKALQDNAIPEKKVTPEQAVEPEKSIAPQKSTIQEDESVLKDEKIPEKKDEVEKVADSYLTGDWGGVRQKMVDNGVTFETIYTSESVFNTFGGVSQGYAVLGNLDLTLDMDMEKLMGWTGGQVFIYGLGGHGQSPTDLVGDLQATSNIEAGMDYFKLHQFWLEQSLFDEKIALLLGLHDLNSEFYTNDPSGLFLNSSFGVGTDLAQSGDNGPSIFPTAALAARLNIQPVESFYINFSGYNAIAGNPDKPWLTAVDFSFSKGFLLIGEVGYYAENNIKIAGGGWMYTQPIIDFSNGNSLGYGAYILFDKTIGENFSFFVRGGMANPLVYQIVSNISEGIHLSGALWGRNDDELGVGATTVINSKSFQDIMNMAGVPSDTQETAFELTYRISATPWIALQPDFQYVLNPGTNPQQADAFIISLRAQLSF